MDISHYRRLIEEVRPKYLDLTGFGEPLLNKSICEMIEFARTFGCLTYLSTNGLALREKGDAIVSSGLSVLQVSLDAADAEIYKTIRFNDQFDNILEGICHVGTCKEQSGRRYPILRLAFVVQKRNLHQVVPFIRIAKELRAEEVVFWPLYMVEVEDRKEDVISGVTEQQIRRTMKLASREAERLGLRGNFRNFLSDLSSHYQRHFCGRINERENRLRICVYPWCSVYVTAEGWLKACCYFCRNDFVFGNVFERGLMKVYNGGKFQEFRRRIARGDRPTSVCRVCLPETVPMLAMRYCRSLIGEGY